jgi:hypothetical protein
LVFQLRTIGLIDRKEASRFTPLASFHACQTQLDPTLLTLLSKIWTENGDMISRQYAGTDAMKVADFVVNDEF